MVPAVISRLVILLFGTLYPAYASYKAVKTKNVKEYVKWMMYWIVFALFMCAEAVTDIFLAFWMPFYYELKIVFVLWLMSPLTSGSSFLYRKFVHPTLNKNEKDIDEFVAKAREEGYTTVLRLGRRGVALASHAVFTHAVNGQSLLLNHMRKSYSMNDLRETQSRPLTENHDMLTSDSEEEEIAAMPSHTKSKSDQPEMNNRLAEERLYYNTVIEEESAEEAVSSCGSEDDSDLDFRPPRQPAAKTKISEVQKYKMTKEKGRRLRHKNQKSNEQRARADTLPPTRKTRRRKPIPDFQTTQDC